MITILIFAFSIGTLAGIVTRERRRKRINKKWGKYIEQLEEDKKFKDDLKL